MLHMDAGKLHTHANPNRIRACPKMTAVHKKITHQVETKQFDKDALLELEQSFLLVTLAICGKKCAYQNCTWQHAVEKHFPTQPQTHTHHNVLLTLPTTTTTLTIMPTQNLHHHNNTLTLTPPTPNTHTLTPHSPPQPSPHHHPFATTHSLDQAQNRSHSCQHTHQQHPSTHLSH